MLQPTPQYGKAESTCFIAGGSDARTSGLSISAPVGHAAMHSPHETQLDSPMGWSSSNTICAPYPFPPRPITSFTCTWSHPRMHRSHRMHAPWSTAMTLEEVSLRVRRSGRDEG